MRVTQSDVLYKKDEILNQCNRQINDSTEKVVEKKLLNIFD